MGNMRNGKTKTWEMWWMRNKNREEWENMKWEIREMRLWEMGVKNEKGMSNGNEDVRNDKREMWEITNMRNGKWEEMGINENSEK